MSRADRAHLVSDTMTSLSSPQVAHGNMNSCGDVHGNSHGVMHANSGGAVVHRNSCATHGDEVLGRTKPLSMSTPCMVRRLVVGERKCA